jgi:Spy/CpxP family protein refolding chaperone
MLDRQLHKFYISYKLDGNIHLEWVEGINLRHAKERIEMKHEDATDLMDWTNESKDDIDAYMKKAEDKQRQKDQEVRQTKIED